MFTLMLGSGEKTGTLGNILNVAIRDYGKQLEHRLSVIVGIIEPLIIVIMGGIILLIVMAVINPIMSLSNLSV